MFSNPLTHRKLDLWLLAVVTLCSGLIFFPYLDFFRYIAPGDIGRDLYAFEQTLHGAQPYKDYWWVYGPLMPYYYAFFNLILGSNIQSILIGYYFLALLSSVLVYNVARLFLTPIFSFISALWFSSYYPSFFYTFNHAGGILCSLLFLYTLLSYIKKGQSNYIWMSLFSVLLLSLIKINFGLVSLIGLHLVVLLANWLYASQAVLKLKRFWLLSLIVLPLSLLVVYAFFLQGLTIHEIRQCLPYLSSDHPHTSSIWTGLKLLHFDIWSLMKRNWISMSISVLTFLTFMNCLLIFYKHRDDRQDRWEMITFVTLVLFFALYLHEFLLSGVFYRKFWANALGYLMIFFCLDYGTRHFSQFVRGLLITCFIAFLSQNAFNERNMFLSFKQNQQPVGHDKINIYTQNTFEFWDTVLKTNAFLTTRLPDDETFFALPYDPLYYYLTDKKSPTRQLIFFDHINIPSEQEQDIIHKLEEHHVNWILLSNRMISSEHGLGHFGNTYCPLLAEYISLNFSPVAQYGVWDQEPGWAWSHGTLILKRNQKAMDQNKV